MTARSKHSSCRWLEQSPEAGFGLEREFISRPPQEALNLLAIELEEKLEEYIPEVTVANVEGKVNGDGSIEPTIYIERRN